MNKVAVLTSGGDAPGMNAAIRAVVRTGIYYDMEVYGVRYGFEGLIDDKLVRLYRPDVADIISRGGTMLGSSRSPRFMTPEGQDQAVATLKKYGIEAVVVIGGNGSLKGGLELAKKGITVMGLPGTIDNDLNYTDFTIGFDTAVNTCLEAIAKLRDTSTSHNRNTIIEVMGRDCGDIALFSGLAGGAEAVLIPELDYNLEEVSDKIHEGIERKKKHSIIIKAEGSKGSTEEVVKAIADATGKDTKMVSLSYLQRGGSPTANDVMLASRTAAKAMELLSKDAESMAVGMVDNHIVAYPLEEALEMPRTASIKEMMDLVDILSK